MDNIGGNLQDTLSYGAAISPTALYVAHKADVLGIKYAMGAASSVPKDRTSDFSHGESQLTGLQKNLQA